jgi:atypical dual specificity phosphatase
MNYVALLALLISLLLVILPLSDDNWLRYKRVRYEVTLAHLRLTQSVWWNELPGTGIVLGAIPLEEHRSAICALNITAVISVVEHYEMEPSLFATPLRDIICNGTRLSSCAVEAEDFLPLTGSQFAIGEGVLDQWLTRGERVYVHCKGGRGRSASLVLSYLMIRRGFTLDEALDFIRHHRPSVNPSPAQRDAVIHFVKNFHPKT